MGKIWSVGVTVKHGYSGCGKYGWWAECWFERGGEEHDIGSIFRKDTMNGKITTRYASENIEDAIRYLMDFAQSLGIEFVASLGDFPHLFYIDDGDSKDWPPPDGWRELLLKVAPKFGLESLYSAIGAGEQS